MKITKLKLTEKQKAKLWKNESQLFAQELAISKNKLTDAQFIIRQLEVQLSAEECNIKEKDKLIRLFERDMTMLQCELHDLRERFVKKKEWRWF